MAKNLIVFGGTGFLGSSICKFAVSQGLKVVSISRSGAPDTLEPWQSNIEYIKGSALDPSTYSDLLPSTFSIIHSIGTLFNLENPLNLKNTYEGSYEKLNKDTALRICETIESKNISFVYISAEKGVFFSPKYLSTKREVEDYLTINKDKITSSVLRPGFLYSDYNLPTKILSCVVDVFNYPEKQFKGRVSNWVVDNLLPSKSLNIDTVAKVAVLCAIKEELKGVTLDVEQIEQVSKNYYK